MTVEGNEEDEGVENPLMYDRDGEERLRPGISKVKTEGAECPECGSGLVHLPPRDPVNPYEESALIMCSECYRAILVESNGGDGENPHTLEPTNVGQEPEGEQATLFEMIGVDEPEGASPDPGYDREHAGYTAYGYTGPVGVTQKFLSDFEETEDECDGSSDGGRGTRGKQ